MSEQDFELYLTLLAKTLRLSDKQRSAIANELRDHLEARLDELTAQGLSKRDAIQTALSEFGDASALANDFSHIPKKRTRRHIMQTTFGTLAACAAVTFATMTLAPSNFFSGQPTQPMAGAQDAPATQEEERRELAIQAVVRDVRAPAQAPVRSIHVIDCTQILVPRTDGLDLLDRTASLALAIETTVASVDPHGRDAITVQAFEEFLIVTATDEAFAQAELLLDQIGARVQDREAIRRAEAEGRMRDELNHVQTQIDHTAAELAELQNQAAEVQALQDAMVAEGLGADHPEVRNLLREYEGIQSIIDTLQHNQRELEQQHDRLQHFGRR